MKKYLMLLFLLIIGSSCLRDDKISPQPDAFINPLQSQMDKDVHAAFLQYRSKINTVGLTIGILRNDETHFYGYGETKIGNRQTPDSLTFFEIGSITKVFTVIAAVDFLNERNLPLETPIKEFLPSDIPQLQKGGVEINFQHLMTHTSGLPYMPDNLGLNTILNIDKAWREYSPEKLYQYLRRVKLESTPGTRWQYSNLAVGALGHILERSTSKKYEQIIRERVTLPLGLGDTKMTLSETEWRRMSKGYEGAKEIDYWSDLNALNGAGVLRSTTADLLKFAKINFNLPDTPLGRAMQRCQQQTFVGKDKDGKLHVSYLGWQGAADSAEPIWFHDGGTGGFHTNLFLFQRSRTALVVFFNSVETSKSQTEARGEFMARLATIANQ